MSRIIKERKPQPKKPMKRTVLLLTILSLAGSALAASPKEEVQSAAKRLAAASYSWKTSVENAAGGGRGRGGGFGTGPMEGKAAADGTLFITAPRADATTEVVLKGDQGAVKTGEGWQSLAELAAARRSGDAAGGSRAGRGAGIAAYRNFKAPAAQVEDLLGKVKELKLADGAYAGELSEDGAKSLLTTGGGRGGANAPTVSGAKGNVKFWLHNGTLSKYQVHVQGTVTPPNGNERQVDRTTTVEIKDVGATKFEVPEEAKKKLS